MTKKPKLITFLLIFALFFFVMPLAVSGSPVKMISDESFLYVAHDDGTIETFDKDSGSLESSFQSLTENPYLWGFETDGNKFYVRSYENKIYVFDMEGRGLGEIELESESSAIYIDRKNPKFLYVGLGEKIMFWNIEEWRPEKTSEAQNTYINTITSDDRYLYLTSEESISVWDRETLTFVKKLSRNSYTQPLKNEDSVIMKITVFGDRIYTGHSKGEIGIWNLTKGSLTKEIDAHPNEVKGVVTDGQYLYSIGSNPNKDVKIWTMEGEPAKEDVETERPTTGLMLEGNNIYVGAYYGGIYVYDKNDLGLVRKIGNFDYIPTETPQDTGVRETETSEYNPIIPIIIVFFLFLVAVIGLEVYTSTKRKEKKITKKGIADSLKSFVSIEDILKIVILSSIIIFVIGLFNTTSIFPNYIPGLQAIYYFDIFVKRGAFLPVWFILLPSLAYWITKKKKRMTRYVSSLVALVIAAIVYLVAPTL